jgi:cell division protein FtsB
VRDVHRKTPTDTKSSGDQGSADSAPTELQALHKQVAALTEENQALRAQVAQLKAQLRA